MDRNDTTEGGDRDARGRIRPWRMFSVAQGNTIQLSGLLGAALLARTASRRGAGGTRWLYASRLLAYFTEHAFSHWLVGRLLGIRFTGYGLHGTSHPHLYPPGLRWVFSHLPFLSARVDPASLHAASRGARAAMYAAGALGTVVVGLAIPLYALRHGIPGAQKLLLVSGGVTNVVLLLSESFRDGGDLRRAWQVLRTP